MLRHSEEISGFGPSCYTNQAATPIATAATPPAWPGFMVAAAPSELVAFF